MNLDRGSILNFTPVDPDLWEVSFAGSDDGAWTETVIGFAVVIVATHGASDGHMSHSKLLPVVLDEDGLMANVYEYLEDWGAPTPTWALKRKA